MALFSLSDIKFKTEPKRSSSVNKYESVNYRFPEDLGNVDKGHYMVININVQDRTNFDYTYQGEPTIFSNRTRLAKSTGGPVNLGGIYDEGGNIAKEKIDTTIANLNNSQNKIIQDIGGGLNTVRNFFNTVSNQFVSRTDINGQYLTNAKFLRTIKRTTDTVALYMPDTVNFAQNQNFSDLTLGGENLSFVGAAGYSAISSNRENLLKNVTPFIADFVKRQTSSVLGSSSTQAIFSSALGAVQNPQLELIYTSPNFRSFNFEFNFYPRSEKEAVNVQNIIQRLKFHQAPELLKGSAGYFLVPPSEFDIKFYYNGQINPNIPEISTCVMTSINVDYAPNGFQTFESESDSVPRKGKTGMPVGIRMTLGFKETEIITKYNYPDEKTPRLT